MGATILAQLASLLPFLFGTVSSITTFVSLIVVTTTPWMVIMTIGYFVRRGYYLPEAMQVFNRGQKGGPYWFSYGWNVPGAVAWGLPAVNRPIEPIAQQ
jgi:purine-cytosine permease-like protein